MKSILSTQLTCLHAVVYHHQLVLYQLVGWCYYIFFLQVSLCHSQYIPLHFTFHCVLLCNIVLMQRVSTDVWGTQLRLIKSVMVLQQQSASHSVDGSSLLSCNTEFHQNFTKGLTCKASASSLSSLVCGGRYLGHPLVGLLSALSAQL